MAQNVGDAPAFKIAAEADGFNGGMGEGESRFGVTVGHSAGQRLATARFAPQIAPISFFLNELRDNARSKMTVEKEALALDLAVDGYHA